MSTLSASGGCHCGAIRYTITATQADVANCHCRACQQSVGAPFVTWVTVPVEALAVRGEIRWYRSSPRGERGFCATCGTSLTFRRPSEPTWVDVTVASLDEPALAPPTYEIWTTSRVPWLPPDPRLPAYAESGPDAPPAPPHLPALPYHPVVVLPPGTPVLGPGGASSAPGAWGIGRYDEVRTIYTQPLFGGARTVHVGLDLGAPAGTAVHAFWAGTVLHAGVNPAAGDYGPTVITEHDLDGRRIYALHGHLSAASLVRSPVGRRFEAGEVLGWLGEPEENGGWPPHVHFQLAWERPATHDLPGVVTPEERLAALTRFPDPRWVLGPLHD